MYNKFKSSGLQQGNILLHDMILYIKKGSVGEFLCSMQYQLWSLAGWYSAVHGFEKSSAGTANANYLRRAAQAFQKKISRKMNLETAWDVVYQTLRVAQ